MTGDTIEKAKSIVNNFDSNGGTNIYVALKVALRLVELSAKNNKENSRQPLIVFLTDGDPTVDISDPNRIVEQVRTIIMYFFLFPFILQVYILFSF